MNISTNMGDAGAPGQRLPSLKDYDNTIQVKYAVIVPRFCRICPAGPTGGDSIGTNLAMLLTYSRRWCRIDPDQAVTGWLRYNQGKLYGDFLSCVYSGCACS